MKRALLILVIAFAATSGQQKDDRKCRVNATGTTDSSHATRQQSVTGKMIIQYGGGVKANCVGTDMWMSGDSLEYVEDAGLLTIVGHARYTESGSEITANVIQYFENDAHILALGDVHIRTKNRSTMTGSQMNYFRPIPGTRPYSRALAVGRPHAELRDSVGSKDTTTTLIDADRIYMERDSIFFAGGNAVITRPDLIAKADSIETDTGRQLAHLLGGSPHVQGVGENTFTLDGNVLDVFSKERQINRLLAKGKAVAVNDSLKLTADTLDMRMSRNRIDSVAAWGPGIAHATSPERDIRGNRLNLSMPGGRMRSLLAIGSARADSRPDSAVHSTERDWIEGDTLRATFDTVPPKDTTKRAQLKLVIAIGRARSFYHSPPKEKTDTVGGVNYVVGKRIDVTFRPSGKQDVQVTGQVHGLTLEAERKDTAAAKPPKPPKPPPRKAP